MGSVSPLSVRHALTELRSRGFVAMAVLLLLTGVVVALVLWGQSVQAGQVRLVDMIGTQRMLAQRIALLAERPGLDPRQAGAQELSSLRVRLRQEVRAMRADPALPAEVAALYAIAWDSETGVMIRFDQAVQAVLDGTGRANAINHREAMLFGDQAARQLRISAPFGADELRMVCVAMFLLMMAGTVGFHFLLVMPLARRIRQQGGLHAAMSDAITQSGHGVLMLDDLGGVSYANSHAGQVLGHGDALVGMNLAHLVFSAHGEDTARAILDKAADQSWRGDVRMIQNNGAVFWAEMVVSATAAESGFLVLFFDATPRREAEAKLRQARERLAVAIDAVDDGFALYDSGERLLTSNRTYGLVWPQLAAWVTPGITFSDLMAQAWALGAVRTDLSKDAFLAQALASFRAADTSREVMLADGRTIRVSERRTPEGGRVVVVSDVTELRQGRERLRRALEQAEAANRVKTVFLSSMSHELRTPLNTILGFAQLLDGTPDGVFGAKQRRSVDKILRAGQALDTLIDQVLDLSHLQSGQVEPDIGEHEPAPLVAECVEAVQDRLEQAGVELRVVVPAPVPPVLADRERLVQVVHVLLSNAIKFTPAGGTITVALSASANGRVRLAVSDTGPGISRDQQQRLFSPFDRLGSENSSVAGAGIGLTIARTLVELMGGHIGVDSREGAGSTFWIDLTAAASALDVAGRVLIIDGDGASQALVASLAATQPGVTVEVVDTGTAGVERAILGGDFDLIMVDLAPADIDGVEVCRRLRHSPTTRFVPLVAAALAKDGPSPAEIGALGFDAVLHRPWDVAQTRELLRRYCPAAPPGPIPGPGKAS